MSIETTVETDVVNDLEAVWDWLDSKAAKVAAFLKPIINDVVSTGSTTLLGDLATALPTVTAALVSGGESAALTAAETFVKSTVEQQGIQLATETVATLSSALVAQAKAAPATASSAAGTAASSASGTSTTAA